MLTPLLVAERATHWAENVRDLKRLGVTNPRKRSLDPVARAGLRAMGLRYLPDGALADPQWVLDVGANKGEWTAGVAAMCEPKRLVLVEPDPRLTPALQSAFGSRPNMHVEEVAITDGSTDSVELNLTADSWANSVLQPRTAEMNATYGHDAYTVLNTVTVPARSIDTIAADAPEITLLKMDIQGAELAALAGATKTLAKTRFIQLEVLFHSHYEGDTTVEGLLAAMRSYGFELASMSPPSSPGGRAMWSDAFFRRTGA